ncbi:Epoxyqueuosine reductase [Mycobacteroides abscessus subsp. abscessus]|nr:Epoxyqueuosine reductase [Mycobacteroides abscessus subsp. abscessus]
MDDLIQVMVSDPRPVIKGTAAWALGKIGGLKAREAVEAALVKETDEEVRREMENSLYMFS